MSTVTIGESSLNTSLNRDAGPPETGVHEALTNTITRLCNILQFFMAVKTIIEQRHEKPNVLVSDLVRHIPVCTAIEDG